jgi:hypothetical protein
MLKEIKQINKLKEQKKNEMFFELVTFIEHNIVRYYKLGIYSYTFHILTTIILKGYPLLTQTQTIELIQFITKYFENREICVNVVNTDTITFNIDKNLA